MINTPQKINSSDIKIREVRKQLLLVARMGNYVRQL